MFYLGAICKPGILRSLWAAVLVAASLVIGASSAQAAGEDYTWTSPEKTGINATHGNFGTSTVPFSKTADKNGGAVFTSNAAYLCGNTTKTTKLTITIDADNLKINPSRGTVSGIDPGCANSFTPAIIYLPNVNPVTGTPIGEAATKQECNQGGLTWLFCPVIDNISSSISSLAQDVLVPLLRVNQVTQNSTPELYKAWTHMRDLADVFFILIFLMIIAGTMLQQDIGFFDAYTLRKLWPRFVMAVILVQFSFIFCGFLVDIGNISGAGVEKLLADAASPSSGPATVGNLLQNLVAGGVGVIAGAGALAVLASWTAALPILVSLLISLLVVFLTLGARFLLIAVLIVVSPLAFAALVLPNTNKYFGNWLEFLFRLIMMYPLVVGIIIVASMINKILPFSADTADSGPATVAAGIIKPLIVVAAFLIIPVSFRLAGAAMQRVHGLLSRTAQQGKGLLKGSEMWQRGTDKRQERKNELMGRVLSSKPVTGLKSKGAVGRGAAGLMSGGAALALLRAPGSTESLQRSNSQRLAALKKQAEGLDEGWNPANVENALLAYRGKNAAERAQARAKALENAPNLLRIADTPLGQRALLQLLNDREQGEKVSKLLDASLTTNQPKSFLRVSTGNLAGNYAADVSAVQSKRNYIPGGVIRMPEGRKDYEVKDAAGNVIRTEAYREKGQVNISEVATAFSKAGKNIGKPDKHTLDDWKLMAKTGRIDKDDKPEIRLQKNVGRDTFEGMLLGTDMVQMHSIFDVSNPALSESNYAVRLEAFKAFKANQEFLQPTIDGKANERYRPEYKAHFDVATSQLINDRKVVSELMPQVLKEYTIDPVLNAPILEDVNAQSAIIRDWVRGEFRPENMSSYLEKGVDFRWESTKKKIETQVENRLRVQSIKGEVGRDALQQVNQERRHKGMEELPASEAEIQTSKNVNPGDQP